jgi:membrane protease YdiL (CAAX protease family)
LIEDPEIPPPPPPEPRPREIPLWVPFAALLGVLTLANLIFATVFGIVSANDPTIKEVDDLPQGAQIVMLLVQNGIFVLAAVIAVRISLDRISRDQFGLRRVKSFKQALGLVALGYVALVLLQFGLVELFGKPEDQSLVTEIKAEDSLAVLIPYAFVICVAAPFAEEFFFRGFMFTVFYKRLGLIWAALLDGVIFGLGHAPADPIQLVALGAFGFGLCLLYWRTQSIIPCMALHALNNSITFALSKDLDGGELVGVVALSIGAVVAAGTALSARRPAVAA